MAPLEPSICWQAIYSRDSRFDGRFFAGATTTGLYCRNVCPVPFARPKHIVLFPCAEAAEAAGFRPCKRCQAQAARGTPAWLGTSAVVARALRLILGGALNEGSVEQLAARLGLGARQLRRLFVQRLGTSPLKIATAQRVCSAKTLIGKSSVPMTEIAFSAGFRSIREFNHAIHESTGQSPTELRRKSGAVSGNAGLELHLPFREPFAWVELLAFLKARAVLGVEKVSDNTYRRTIELAGSRGTLAVSQIASGPRLLVQLDLDRLDNLAQIVERIRRLFDLGADPLRIAALLSQDPQLRARVERRPGLRVPGVWDGFEAAVLAALGQRLTAPGSRKLVAAFVKLFGIPIETSITGLAYLFPRAEALLDADLAKAGMSDAQATTLRELARRAASKQLNFGGAKTLEETVAQIRLAGGFDESTANYIAMRAAGEPDAFPADELRPGAAAETWRPWRAYAAMHLATGKPRLDGYYAQRRRKARPPSAPSS